MAAKFVQEGKSLDYTPGGAVAAGDVIVQGTLVGVALRAIAANRKGALCVSGVLSFPKDTTSGSALSVGAEVYWDAGNEVVTTTSAGNTYVGKVVKAAADSDTTVDVLLEQ